jgi:hypothetical protein
MFSQVFTKIQPLQEIGNNTKIEILIIGSGPAPETFGFKKVFNDLMFYCADRVNWV